MAQYIRFPTADGGAVLIEVAETVVQEEEREEEAEGLVKAGLRDKVAEAGKKVTEVVIEARDQFEETVMETVRRNAEAFIQMMRGLSDPPAEAEIAFGLKVTGEAGYAAAAVAKAGGEATYTVTLTWRREEVQK